MSKTFSDLGLETALVKALHQKGYQQPTPIQEKAIPVVLNGSDLFGCAQTGTGKTAAFALPVLQQLQATSVKGKSKVRALILAPTRELVIQIADNLTAYGSGLGISHVTIYGGVSQHHQVKVLQRGVDVVVATPGRLLDLIQQRHLRLDQIEHLILDEADRLLDMGFIRDIQRIVAMCPQKRQTLLFSATLSPEIKKLTASILKNPEHVAVNPVSSTSSLIEQSVMHVEKAEKKNLLTNLLKKTDDGHVLVFTRTKRGADRIAKDLVKQGVSANAIHGNKSQGARERALSGFKSQKIKVLVATDIASRGIDVDHLNLVVNYELPDVAETYVHRIGRTGRAGKDGRAISFCSPEEKSLWKSITKLVNKDIPVVGTNWK